MTLEDPDARFKTPVPSVYLDQWVWIRLARANVGKPVHPDDVALLETLQQAAADGVAFPLSATHYEETSRILDPTQRREIARVMAPISMGRTLRNQTDLVRHQLLLALHDVTGRPTFEPVAPRVLGLGVHWTFVGVEGFMTVVDQKGRPDASIDLNWHRRLNQYCEFMLLCGPQDSEIAGMELSGYVPPRTFETGADNRLDWERSFEVEAEQHKSREALRRALFARESSHEYGRLLQTILTEYRLSIASISGGNPKTSLARIIEFCERVPTLRVAVEMKLEIFRDPGRRWSWNMLRDIDALSLAIPYCHVVVADRDALSLAERSRAPQRYDTAMTASLQELPDLVADLAASRVTSTADLSDWSTVGPGESYSVDRPEELIDTPHGATIRLLDRKGASFPRPPAAA